MGKMPTDSLGKSSELKLHCFCLFDAYSMPKDMYSVWQRNSSRILQKIQSHPVSLLGILEAFLKHSIHLDHFEKKPENFYDVKIGPTFTGCLLLKVS